MTARYFRSASQWRAWLDRNHATVSELWVGLDKEASGKTSMTYSVAVDHALCFGWIDGLRKSVDESRWRIRFTPRKPKSKWSQVNIRRVKQLLRLGLMMPAGLRAFRGREQRSTQYSYEQTRRLDSVYEGKLRKHREAWRFFEAQPPSYRRAASWWIMSARKEETRLRRLATLVRDSEQGLRLSWAR